MISIMAMVRRRSIRRIAGTRGFGQMLYTAGVNNRSGQRRKLDSTFMCVSGYRTNAVPLSRGGEEKKSSTFAGRTGLLALRGECETGTSPMPLKFVAVLIAAIHFYDSRFYSQHPLWQSDR